MSWNVISRGDRDDTTLKAVISWSTEVSISPVADDLIASNWFRYMLTRYPSSIKRK